MYYFWEQARSLRKIRALSEMKPKDGLGIQEKPFKFTCKQVFTLTTRCLLLRHTGGPDLGDSKLCSAFLDITTESWRTPLSCFVPRNVHPSSSEMRAQNFRPTAATQGCTYEKACLKGFLIDTHYLCQSFRNIMRWVTILGRWERIGEEKRLEFMNDLKHPGNEKQCKMVIGLWLKRSKSQQSWEKKLRFQESE